MGNAGEGERTIAVRYAWQDSPLANLQNKQGMPVGTFRSDIWELQTQARVTTPLVLKTGGTPDKPEVFDGQGMLIDLGTRVSEHDWVMDGDLWTSQPGLPEKFRAHSQDCRANGRTLYRGYSDYHSP